MAYHRHSTFRSTVDIYADDATLSASVDIAIGLTSIESTKIERHQLTCEMVGRKQYDP